MKSSDKDDRSIVLALGLAEIIHYGTLYYCVAVVANEISRDFEITNQWIFACFSFALCASALTSFIAGRLMDQHGAGTTMKIASVAGAVSLGMAAASRDVIEFSLALFGMQIASTFLFNEAGFVLLVQRDAVKAPRQITRLALIVGFSSTLFWPLTSGLLTLMSWRAIFGIYAGANVFVALPLVAWALQRRSAGPRDHCRFYGSQALLTSGPRLIDFVLITAGFSLTAFVFSAFVGQMLPILSSYGLGQETAVVSALFGPSQFLVRLFVPSLSERMTAIQLTIVSCVLLFLATVVILLWPRSLLGAATFIVLLGFSSGLNSICRGTLPLSVFGKDRYANWIGFIGGIRLLVASFAPVFFSSIQGRHGITIALSSLVLCGAASVFAFVLLVPYRRRA
ncbi:MFS transporter [Bradyrhizobium sp. B124]|uniref:MFS transporter n=1 Tax=Bradyrhizobium sp. B124 TaxID=3140245 RepID=UPI0031838AF4